METNQEFLESFFAGFNHELARELLWREYPTDQRGTYSRTFWDISDDVAADQSSGLAIKPMHEWQGPLGTHRNDDTTRERVVLVVRGQLFRKFPHTLVYAHKATGVRPSGLSDPSVADNIRYPLFKARLEPDVHLFGFDLDGVTARGDPFDAANAGWFFMFKERPGEPNLGLDEYEDALRGPDAMPEEPPAKWTDFAWEHLVAARSDLDSYHLTFSRPVSITQPEPDDPTFGSNSADLASILFQNPVIFGRHARELLPQGDSDA
jgi:hypothetical protein